MNENLASQEELREELIDGEIVLMAPKATGHVFTAGNIFGIFYSHLKGKAYRPIGNGALVFLAEKDHFVPDFMVVCDRGKIKYDGVHGAPDLVVEVLSPSTAKRDKSYKKDVYAKCGVREYWLVSPAEKSVEVYRGEDGVFVFHDLYTVYPDWMLERMSGEERAKVVTHFQCSLFDDLDIYLDDIFSNLLP